MLNSKYKIIAYFCCAFVCAFLGLELGKDSVSAFPVNLNQNVDVVVHSEVLDVDYNYRGLFSSLSSGFNGYILPFSTLDHKGGFIFVSNEYRSISKYGNSSTNSFSTSYLTKSFPNHTGFYYNTVLIADNSNTIIGSGFTPVSFNFSDLSDISSLHADSIFELVTRLPSVSDKSLGYIDVTRSAFLTVKDDKLLSFDYSSSSSTGVDLSDSRYYLRIKGLCEVRFVGHTYRDTVNITGNSDGNLLPASAQKFVYNFSNFIEYAPNVREGLQRSNGGIYGLLPDGLTAYTFDFVVQIVDTTSNSYGPWLDIHYDLTNPDASSIVTRPGHIDPDTGQIIFDDPITGDPTDDPDNTDVPNGEGEGTTVTDADDNAKDNTNTGGSGLPDIDKLDFNKIINSLKSAIKSFYSAIQSFVGLVKTTFGYLPNWCLDFFALAFVIWCIMIIKRAIF